MDILVGLRIQMDAVWYNALFSLAGLHWSLLRGFIMMGHTLELLNEWLRDHAFAPLIQQTNASLGVAVSLAFVVAMFTLGITYMLSIFIRLDVVNPRSALTWYAAGMLFFSLAPSLYEGMNDFRVTVSEAFYLSTLQGLQSNLGNTFDGLERVESTDLGLGALCDYLGVYLPNATEAGRIDGLDVALSYLRADGVDVMGYESSIFSPGCPVHYLNPYTGALISPIPQEWYDNGSYFDADASPLNFDTMDDAARAVSISMASASQGRMLTAWLIVCLLTRQQLVNHTLNNIGLSNEGLDIFHKDN